MVTLPITGDPLVKGRRIEIIKENFKTKVCSQMPNYPLEVYLAGGSIWKDGKFSICGGVKNYNKKYSKCYLMENGEWKLSGKLQTARSYHGASNIGNSIWITGGYKNDRLASTEIIHSDGKITPGPDLPEARHSHCQISYEQSTFIIGKCIFANTYIRSHY